MDPSAHDGALAEEVLGTEGGTVPMSPVLGGDSPGKGGSSESGVFVGFMRDHGRGQGLGQVFCGF